MLLSFYNSLEKCILYTAAACQIMNLDPIWLGGKCGHSPTVTINPWHLILTYFNLRCSLRVAILLPLCLYTPLLCCRWGRAAGVRAAGHVTGRNDPSGDAARKRCHHCLLTHPRGLLLTDRFVNPLFGTGSAMFLLIPPLEGTAKTPRTLPRTPSIFTLTHLQAPPFPSPCFLSQAERSRWV